ncbi:MAG: SDR family NAD(P)-dependent oxidoreductase [Pseudomonadales bacterium]
MSELAGRVALVTGAGRGVGRATALRLAREGVHIVANDLDLVPVEETVAAIRSIGGSALAAPGDITAADTPDTLITIATEAFGSLDIVVNNAGYIWNGAMHRHNDTQWQAMLDIHATAPFRILRAWFPWLKARALEEQERLGAPLCRKVVNVSSVSGTRGAATQIAYATGKAAVIGLTRTLAREWGRYNVCVNCVAFGHIETRLTQPYADDPPRIEVGGREHRVGLTETQIEAVRLASPLGRAGTPEDGAGAIYLLCLPESDFITGEVLTCSGGA